MQKKEKNFKMDEPPRDNFNYIILIRINLICFLLLYTEKVPEKKPVKSNYNLKTKKSIVLNRIRKKYLLVLGRQC